jgi:hypothetical protein
MIRFVLRALGTVIAAGGFIAMVIDGVKTLANGVLVMTPLGQYLYQLLAERYLLLQPGIERHIHPLLWDPVVLNLTLLPASVVGLVLGAFLVWLGRPPHDPGVGVLTRA